MASVEGSFVQLVSATLFALADKILLASLTLLVGIIIARMLGKLTMKILQEIDVDGLIKKLTGVETALDEVCSIAVMLVFYAMTFLLALNILGVERIALEAIGVLITAIIVISILLTLQHAIPNVFAGLILHQRKIIRVGDQLKLKSISGSVTHIGLFEITLQSKDRETVYVPNRSLLTEKHFSVARKH